MGAAELVRVGGAEVWANVTEVEGGARVRFALDDWERLGQFRGARVEVRLRGGAAEALYVAEVSTVPPFVWALLVRRVRAAG